MRESNPRLTLGKRQCYHYTNGAWHFSWDPANQHRSYGVMVSTLDFESSDPGSNPGRSSFLFARPPALCPNFPSSVQQSVPVAKWIRRRFPEPKTGGSSPFRDAFLPNESTYGLVGYDVRLTRGRSPVRSWVGVSVP